MLALEFNDTAAMPSSIAESPPLEASASAWAANALRRSSYLW